MKDNDMDWNNFKVEPDDGMFEKIMHRLRVRRAWRIAGVGATVALVVAAALLLAPDRAGNNVNSASQAAVAEVPRTHAASLQKNDSQPVGLLQNDTEAQQRELQQTALSGARQQSPMVQGDEIGNDARTWNLEPGTWNLEPSSVSDETDMADILPRTSLQVIPLVEQQTPPMDCTPVPIMSLVNDSVKPDIVIETPLASSKSGEPQPVPYHEDNLIWVPNIIVPNGDIDENRYFRIITSSPITDFNIHIYNRGGRLLFDSNDPSFSWNATLNGMPLPQGAYVYVATFRDTDGTPRQQTGTVTVVR